MLHARRRELRMTQDEVARRIGVHANYIGYLEKGARRPGDKTLGALCRLMNLDRLKVMKALRPAFRDVAIGPADAPGGGSLPPLLEELRRDTSTRRRHRILDQDIRNLTVLDAIGTVGDKAGYVRFLEVIREIVRP